MSEPALNRLGEFKKTLSFYWRIVGRSHWKSAAVLLAMMVGSALMEMATVGLTVPLLDLLSDRGWVSKSPILVWVTGALHRAGFPSTVEVVMFVVLGMACGLFFLRGALMLSHQCATAVIGQKMRRDMKL